MIAITQVSDRHWSKTVDTTVNDCHDVGLHLSIIREQMLLCCQLLFKVCGAHGEQHSQSHVFGQQVSGALSVTLFPFFPGLDGVREVVYLGGFR